MSIRWFAYSRLVARAALVGTLLLTPGAAQAQASRYVYELPAYPISTNGPRGVTFPISVTSEGRISEFWWWFNSTGWGDLHIRYTLPDGTYLEQVAGQPWEGGYQFYGKEALGTWTLRLTENQPHQSNTFSTGFTVVAIRDATTNLPISGTYVPALAGADSIITNWMRANQIEATTLAVMKNGKLVYSRGYGWQDRARTTPALPEAVSRWASNTKMLTAAAIRILMAQGKLNPSDRAWDVMAVQPPAGYTVTDPRHFQYTIDELLNHRAGLPHDVDLEAGPLGALLGLGRAATLTEMVAYMWSTTLPYDPNPDPLGETHYSNWGYQLLGAIIEKVSGMSYDAFVRGYVTAPLGATTFQVGHRGPNRALPNELWYAGRTFIDPQWDWNYSMAMVEDPYGDDLETRPGAGSLVSSATDYMRFLKAYFHTGEPKPASLVGWSWDYTFYGGGPGNCSATREDIWPDGSSLDWSLLVNESPTDESALANLRASLDTFFAGVTRWPSGDMLHTPAFVEQSGQVVLEAEHFAAASPRTDVGPWQVSSAQSGFVGDGYITMPSGPCSTATWSNGAEATYNVKISTTGDYYLWLRRYITSSWDNAAYVGVDGRQVGSTVDNSTSSPNKWAWYKYGTKLSLGSAGQHTLSIRRGDRGYKIDRILLTKNGSYTPSGNGPTESPRP